MSSNRIRQFSEIFEVETFLNGGIILGQVQGAVAGQALLKTGLYGLVGATLIFTSPSAVTVTFVASSGTGGSADPAKDVSIRNPDPSVLTFDDLKLQIEAAIATVRVLSFKGSLVLREVTPTSGVTISDTGTANAVLGAPKAASGSVVGKVYAPPPSTTAPCWTWHTINGSNAHTVFTLE